MLGKDRDEELRPGEEDALVALLHEMDRAAGPPEQVTRQVRAAVEAEWRAGVAARRAAVARRWRTPVLALAASLAVAALAVWTAAPLLTADASPLATLSRVSGAVESGTGSDWQPVVIRQTLMAGQELVTGPRGRAALSLGNGITLRLDVDTRIALAARDHIVVDRGAVYLDSGTSNTAPDPFTIESRFGTTRHLGTQYEVRVAPDEMRVSVREGRVEFAGSGGVAQARAGEQLAVSANGSVRRQAVPRVGPLWAWTQDVTPPFAIEQRPLTEFLTWVSRETGRELAFESPQVESASAQIVLRGSVAGLPPDAALAAVMATTPLSYSGDVGEIRIHARSR